MKLYTFDGVDRTLELLPLAARRALDLAGLHLTLEGYLSLPLETRTALAELGSKDAPDVRAIAGVVSGARPSPTPCPVVVDPASDEVPFALARALGPRKIPLDVWKKLSPLDRASLAKVAMRGKPERLSAAFEEIVGSVLVSTHLRPGAEGGVHMVSVSGKESSVRRAVAEAVISMTETSFARLVEKTVPKGDVLQVARVAGIMATKRTSDIIPLCHPILIEHVDVEFELREPAVVIRCAVETTGRTGVEMEAMTGATAAALTLYDMMKSLDRGIVIGQVRLLHKSGGRSGTYSAESP